MPVRKPRPKPKSTPPRQRKPSPKQVRQAEQTGMKRAQEGLGGLPISYSSWTLPVRLRWLRKGGFLRPPFK